MYKYDVICVESLLEELKDHLEMDMDAYNIPYFENGDYSDYYANTVVKLREIRDYVYTKHNRRKFNADHRIEGDDKRYQGFKERKTHELKKRGVSQEIINDFFSMCEAKAIKDYPELEKYYDEFKKCNVENWFIEDTFYKIYFKKMHEEREKSKEISTDGKED